MRLKHPFYRVLLVCAYILQPQQALVLHAHQLRHADLLCTPVLILCTRQRVVLGMVRVIELVQLHADATGQLRDEWRSCHHFFTSFLHEPKSDFALTIF